MAVAVLLDRPEKRAPSSSGLSTWESCHCWEAPVNARELLADLPNRTVLSAEEAFRLLGVDRSTGYKAIQDGTFPVPVLRIGRQIRVPAASLIRLLEAPIADGEASGDAR